MSVRIDIRYPAGHTYAEKWDRDEENLRCPGCGQKGGIWIAASGDYYVGEERVCTICGFSFHLPNFYAISAADEVGQQRLTALRAAS